MTTQSNHPVRNRLLASLQHQDFVVLQAHLERRSLEQGIIIESPGRTITHVYFPEPGVVSVVAQASAELRLEAGIVGPEGMTGLALLYGTDRSPNETVVQIPCRAWCLEAGILRHLLRDHRAIHDRLLLYAHVFSVQVTQGILVNGRLTLGDRLARWLLMCHDRADREDLPLTHEFLSLMLGVRRAGITTALQALEGAGAIAMRRGTVLVRDRAVLMEAAGDGYGVPEAEYRRVLSAP